MSAPAYSWSKKEPPRTAPLVPRATAFGLDLVGVAALTYAAWKLAGAAGFLPAGGFLNAYGFLLIAELPVGLLYFTIAEGVFGTTPGKRVSGLRVTDLAGEPVSGYQAFLRNLLRFLWATPVGPAFLVLDAWLVWTGEMEQRLGDLAAGTIVVDRRRADA